MKGVGSMAKQKKEVQHFRVIDEKIVLEEKDIPNLTEEENTKIAFFVKTLGYEVVFVEPEPKKSNYFTVAKAEKYLNQKRDKEGLKKFRDFKKKADQATAEYKAIKKAEKEGGEDKPSEDKVNEARRAMIIAQKDAFLAQKEWFKDTFGTDEYERVRKEY